MAEREPLSISVITSPVIAVPLTKEGVRPGWSGSPDKVMHTIAEGLAKKGHEVTLYTCGDTVVKHAKLASIEPKSSLEHPEVGMPKNHKYEAAVIAKAMGDIARGKKVDIIISRFLLETASDARLLDASGIPTISVQVSRMEDNPRFILESEDIAHAQHYVSCSDNQRGEFNMDWAGTIYHGVDPEVFTFSEYAGTGGVIVGRIRKDKDPRAAILATQQVGDRLTIVGSNRGEDPTREKEPYWEETLEMIDPHLTQLVGHVDQSDTPRYYQNARYFLYSGDNNEPFAVAPIESMSCGTPVIAYAEGAMSEAVVDGETGFLINRDADNPKGDFLIKETGIEGLVAAIKRINEMTPEEYQEMRHKCRERVMEKFTDKKMVENYERIIFEVLEKKKQSRL